MPRKSAATAEVEEAPEFAAYVTNRPTVTAEGIAEWLIENTGIEIADDEMELFVRTIYLTISLRRKYQRDEDARARKDELRDVRKPVKAAAEPDEDEEDEEEAPAKPARRTRSTAPKTTSASSTSPDGAPKTTRSRSKASTPAASGAAPRRSRAPKAAAASGAAPF